MLADDGKSWLKSVVSECKMNQVEKAHAFYAGELQVTEQAPHTIVKVSHDYWATTITFADGFERKIQWWERYSNVQFSGWTYKWPEMEVLSIQLRVAKLDLS